MAKKDTKTKELRVRLPEQHHAILEEYCEVKAVTGWAGEEEDEEQAEE